MREREREGERQWIFHLPGHFPNGHNDPGWDTPKPGAFRSPCGVLGLSSSVFPGHCKRAGSEVEQPATGLPIHMGCHHSQWLYPLFHNTCPGYFSYITSFITWLPPSQKNLPFVSNILFSLPLCVFLVCVGVFFNSFLLFSRIHFYGIFVLIWFVFILFFKIIPIHLPSWAFFPVLKP